MTLKHKCADKDPYGNGAIALFSLHNAADLFKRIPVLWSFYTHRTPRHSSLKPAPPPLLVSDTEVIVRHAELKATRWANLVGAARRPASRKLAQTWVAANRADVSHQGSPKIVGKMMSQAAPLLLQTMQR
jgi:hypothetical protein